MISIIPCQKFGRLKPRIDPVMTVSSRAVPGRRPAQRPSGIPTNEREGKSHEGELERRRHPTEDEIDGRLIEDEGTTQVALEGIPDESAILFDERPVEPKCPDRLFPFGGGRISGDQDIDRIADRVDPGENDDRRNEKNQQALRKAADDEDAHGRPSDPRRLPGQAPSLQERRLESVITAVIRSSRHARASHRKRREHITGWNSKLFVRWILAAAVQRRSRRRAPRQDIPAGPCGRQRSSYRIRLVGCSPRPTASAMDLMGGAPATDSRKALYRKWV